jgi:hypothetical protein
MLSMILINAFVLAVVLLVYLQQAKSLKVMKTDLEHLRKEQVDITRDHPALITADLYFARQLQEINDQLISMDGQLQQLENVRQNDGGYQHALRILEMGGSRDEIMESCHLSKAETDLIMNLHAYRAAVK